MNNIYGLARGENGEYAGIIAASDACGAVVDLEPRAEGVSIQVYHATRYVVHLCTAERRAGAKGVGDGEYVLREGVQDPTGVVEEVEGLVTSVDGGRCGLQVFRFVDIDVGGWGLDGQARVSGNGGYRGDRDRIGCGGD